MLGSAALNGCEWFTRRNIYSASFFFKKQKTTKRTQALFIYFFISQTPAAGRAEMWLAQRELGLERLSTENKELKPR